MALMVLPIKDDDDDPTGDDDARREAELLKKVRLLKFTATPGSIHPFETATLAWDVAVPSEVEDEIPVTIRVAGQPVTRAGSRTVSPLVTGAFLIEAESPNAKRVLGHRIVTVDVSGCQHEVMSIKVLQGLARQAKELLKGAGGLSLRGDIAMSAQPPDGLLIEAPLRAEIPDFFNADVDIDLLFIVSAASRSDGSRVVAARLKSVDVDVSFSVAEHILSLGAAAAVQAIMEPFAADMIAAFAGPVLSRTVAEQLQGVADFILGGFQRTDEPQHRVHKLYSITTEAVANGPGFLSIVGCPVSPGVPHLVAGPRPVSRRSRRVSPK